MIDIQTGDLTLSHTTQIRSGDSLEWVMNLNLGEVQELSDMKTGWKWLTVKNVVVGQDYFVLSFGFHSHVLKTVYLNVSENRFDLKGDWSTWSETGELERLAQLRKWLEKEVGPETHFKWGTVAAYYDRKGGSSSIVLRYE